MALSDIRPDKVLATLLDKQVTVQTSATKQHTIRAYSQAERPTNGLGDEYIEVLFNGNVQSLTKPMGVYSGYLAVGVYVKSYDNDTANIKRINAILNQVEAKVINHAVDGYFFEYNQYSVITSPTVNLTTGYAATLINIAWRTSM
jgi:hypothetical protein